MTTPAAPARTRSRRLRWLRRGLLWIGALLVAAVLALAAVVAALDRPLVKGRVRSLIRARAGVEVDWAATRVRPLSGLHVDGLVVLSPPAWRERAPELLRVEGADVGWRVRALLGLGEGPALASLALRGLALTIVRDEDGGTSLAALGTPSAEPAPPPAPPSRVLADALGAPLPVERVEIERATVTLISSVRGREMERLRVEGLGLQVDAAREGAGARVRASIGQAAAPLRVGIARRGGALPDGAARILLWAEASASPASAEVKLDVELIEQTLAPDIAAKVKRLAHVEARGQFDAAARRTTLELSRTTLADGAASTDAALEVPDEGAPTLRAARGAIDVGRVLALLPAGLVPARAEQARLSYRVERLVLDEIPRLLDGGALEVEGAASGVRAQLPGGSLALGEGRFTLAARPGASEGTTVHAAAPLRGLRLELPGRTIRGDGLEVVLDGTRKRDGALDGRLDLRFAALDVVAGGRVAARDGSAGVIVRELHADPGAPLATRGQVTITGRAGAFVLGSGQRKVSADELRWSASARLLGRPPYAVDVDVPIGHLRVTGDKGRLLAQGPARIELHAADVLPDARRPLRTRASLRAAVALGPARVTLTSRKEADAADYQLVANAGSLSPVRLLVPGGPAWDASWEDMALSLSSSGRVEQLASGAPRLRHRTEARVLRPSFRDRAGTVSAQALTLVSSSSGTVEKHEGEADVRLRLPVVRGTPLGDSLVHVAFRHDLAAPSARVKVKAEGEGGPSGALTLALGYDRARRAVTYDVDGQLARLKVLSPLATAGGLRGFDLSQLTLGISGKGALVGLVTDVDGAGRPRLAPDPVATLGADGTVEVRAAHLRWTRGDREIAVPRATWRATLATDGARRSARNEVDVDSLHFAAGDHQLDVAGVRDELDVTITGDPRRGEGELTQRLSVSTLAQDFAPQYPVGNVALALKARRDGDGVLHVSQLQVDNQAGGTVLDLKGGLDAGGERRGLSLEGEIKQDLSRLWADPLAWSGRGAASVSVRVDTGNLRVFHVLAAVRVAGADLRLPRAGVSVEAMEGEIPITVDLVVDRRGPRFLRDMALNQYSAMRFSDQHPLLRRHSFVSVGRVTTPLVTAAPLVGNLRVDNNVVALSQLEMGLRGGRVTGQCFVDWRKEDTTVRLHVRASRVEGSRREPFDGNAAVVISTRERSVDGRAEILRIGRRHLLDLLGLHDPHHADPAANRIRRALSLGYPDQVRLGFRHGFANVRVTFGGLAKLVRIDELRGIPMGPIIDKVLAPLSRTEEAP